MLVFDIGKIKAAFRSKEKQYQSASPFPNTFIDDFINEEAASKALEAFPRVKDQGWIHYMHVNEKKHGLNKKVLY